MHGHPDTRRTGRHVRGMAADADRGGDDAAPRVDARHGPVAPVRDPDAHRPRRRPPRARARPGCGRRSRSWPDRAPRRSCRCRSRSRRLRRRRRRHVDRTAASRSRRPRSGRDRRAPRGRRSSPRPRPLRPRRSAPSSFRSRPWPPGCRDCGRIRFTASENGLVTQSGARARPRRRDSQSMGSRGTRWETGIGRPASRARSTGSTSVTVPVVAVGPSRFAIQTEPSPTAIPDGEPGGRTRSDHGVRGRVDAPVAAVPVERPDAPAARCNAPETSSRAERWPRAGCSPGRSAAASPGRATWSARPLPPLRAR